ncbi:MAG TPA: hypothetical protein PLZ43_13125 [bacterium]|nr:hypothetical protein [bacterium]
MNFDFKAPYKESEFIPFIRNTLFPRLDFGMKRKSFNCGDFSLNKINSVVQLGQSEKFDLAIYEINHGREN